MRQEHELHTCLIACVPLCCCYHTLTSFVVYYWTDTQQHGIYLLIWQLKFTVLTDCNIKIWLSFQFFTKEYSFLFLCQKWFRKRQQMRSLFLKKHSGRVTRREEKQEWNGFLNCLNEIQLHLMQSTDGFTSTESKWCINCHLHYFVVLCLVSVLPEIWSWQRMTSNSQHWAVRTI